MAAAAHEGITQRVAASGASRDDDDSAAAAAVVSGPNKKPGGGGSGRTTTTTSRRGLRSLAAAVTLSAALTALSFFFAASHSSSSPSSPPRAATTTVAVVRAGSVASEAVLALAAWMAWAEGGMHTRPAATLLPYAAQLGATLAWAPLVLGHGAAATRAAGLACCAAMAAAAVACVRGFGAVNPVAGDLAKPAVAWAVILAVINYKIL